MDHDPTNPLLSDMTRRVWVGFIWINALLFGHIVQKRKHRSLEKGTSHCAKDFACTEERLKIGRILTYIRPKRIHRIK